MFDFLLSEAARIAQVVTIGKDRMTDEQYIVNEINHFKVSQRRKEMLDGEKYYAGKHDILSKTRTAIGESGELIEVTNLPNNRIVDNQYKKMVDQKNNYLLGQPISVQCDNDVYAAALKQIFNKRFQRLLKAVGEDSLNCGIGWVFVYYDVNGDLKFKRINPFEIIPEWHDAEHTQLDAAIRIYEVIAYEGHDEKVVEKVEVYDERGVNYFELTPGGSLTPCEPYFQNYITVVEVNGSETGYNWTKIPLIPFKFNSKEIPLIKMIKTLQDGLNDVESGFKDALEENSRNSIIVLKNYDGENLGEFRRNLATYGAVKVSSIEGSDGGIDSLQIEINPENYKVILELFKKAIIENAMGYDAKDDRLAGNPNQMNIQSMYSDIDLDANNMETEYQAAFEELLFFINAHLANIGVGNFDNENVEIIFNRDILISESEVIENCQKSVGLLSDETIISQHPWVDDPQAEIERLEKQKQEEQAEIEKQYNPFGATPTDVKENEEA